LIPRNAEASNKPVCIIGTGYVGLASAIGLAELGCTIVGYDVNAERVEALGAGVSSYREGPLDALLRKHVRRRRMRFTSDHADAVRGAGLILISVGTPALEDGSADVRDLWRCVHALAERDLSACDAIVIRSTVPPGTSDEIAAVLGRRARVVYAPEFLREGSAVADFLAPDRTVVGADDIEASIVYARLFEPLGAPVMLTTRRNAELIKAASNAFLAIKITFANEVANLCDALGADSDEVLRGVGYDKRIGGDFLVPGIGFGGPYVEKDLRSLRRVADGRNVPFYLAQATLNANDHQPRRIVELVSQEVGQVRGSTIAVWGLAFKAGTDDVRDSLAVRIVRDLVARGASVVAFDPAVRAIPLPEGATLATSAVAALQGADALLVLTEWPEFTRISPSTIAHSLSGLTVVDGRNVLDPQRIAAAGLRYRGVGRAVDGEPQSLPVAI
jgi:UDPglucose 6-dehydrogenase